VQPARRDKDRTDAITLAPGAPSLGATRFSCTTVWNVGAQMWMTFINSNVPNPIKTSIKMLAAMR
jgi:hypothetical protein